MPEECLDGPPSSSEIKLFESRRCLANKELQRSQKCSIDIPRDKSSVPERYGPTVVASVGTQFLEIGNNIVRIDEFPYSMKAISIKVLLL